MFNSKRFASKQAPQARLWAFYPIAHRLGALAGVAIIAFAVFLAYGPSVNGGFILDDDRLVYDNDLIKATDGPRQFWCTAKADDFWPMTNSALWLEWRLWGMHPAGYHVSNLILHVAEALLIWIILQRLSVPGAFLAAMIFAVHPVNVESVAWIAQRKNTMAMLFFLLSILWYLKDKKWTVDSGQWTEDPAPHHPSFIHHPSSFYWLSLGAFVTAMLGKGSVVILPVVLLGIVWWLRPLTTRDIIKISPFFIVAAVLAGVNVWFQTHGSGEVLRAASLTERLLGAGGVVWFYLQKAFLPLDLDFVYPQWNIQSGDLMCWLPLLAALAVTALLWLYRKTWSRPLLFAWGFFCVALVPVMGFTDVGFMKYSLVADHYQHIAIIGAIALVSAGWRAWHSYNPGGTSWAAPVVAVTATAVLAFLTWRQNEIYSDAVTLYQAALEKNPGFWMGRGNLAKIIFRQGRLNDAMANYEQALANYEKAMANYEKALAVNPDFFDAHNDLGTILTLFGRHEEALEHRKKAILLNPGSAEACWNLGISYQAMGQLQEAIDLYKKALRIKPNYAEALCSLGLAMAQKDQHEEAIALYRQALALKPDYPEAHNNLGIQLALTDKLEQAIEHYNEALKIRPNFADAHENLGLALVQAGRIGEGIERYRKALSIKPNYIEAHNNLALALAQTGRIEEAIEHIQFILRLKPDFSEAYFNLALFYARVQRSSDAIDMGRKALEFARAKNQAPLAKKIEEWLNNYRAGSPKQPDASSPSDTPSPPP